MLILLYCLSHTNITISTTECLIVNILLVLASLNRTYVCSSLNMKAVLMTVRYSYVVCVSCRLTSQAPLHRRVDAMNTQGGLARVYPTIC